MMLWRRLVTLEMPELPLILHALVVVTLLTDACSARQASQYPSISSANGNPKYGGEVRTYWSSAFSYLDPQRSSGGNDPFYNELYTASLLELADDGSVIPGLAESWSLPDQKAIVLRLRQGLKFHDGTDLDAAAVKFNIQRGQDMATNSPGRPEYVQIERVETPDKRTVKLDLVAPNAALLLSLAATSPAGIGGIVSPTAVQKWGKDFERHVVAAGPFKIEEYTPEVELVLKRFDDYYGKDADGNRLPYLDRISFRIIPDPAVAAASVQSGEIDVTRAVPMDLLGRLQGDHGISIMSLKGQVLIYLNLYTAKPPLDNLDLRKAIAYAVDRDEIVKAEYAGYAAPAYTAFPSAMWAWDSTIQDYKYDPAKAKEYLAKAGYPGGVKIKAAAYGTPGSYATETVQAQLRRVGIDMTVDRLNLVTYQERFRAEGQYDIGFAGIPAAIDPDRIATGFYSSSGFYNPGKPSVPEFDQLIEKGQSTFDQNERKRIYSQLQHAINDRVHNVFLVYTETFGAYHNYVKGFKWGGTLLGDIRWVWLDK